MPSILESIVENKQCEVEQRRRAVAYEALAEQISANSNSFIEALAGDGVKLIAEIKPSSPSAGTLKTNIDLDNALAGIVDVYAKYASAISVLTDQKYFKGSLALLQNVSALTNTPLLCKDFILSDYQVLEARAHGAQAVLLIVKILDAKTLQKLYNLIVELGMTPVVEIQNESELKTALKVIENLPGGVLLINNRNLSDLTIDFAPTKTLAPLIDKDVIVLCASGIEKGDDLRQLLPYAKRFLIGSMLMKSDNVEQIFKELLS